MHWNAFHSSRRGAFLGAGTVDRLVKHLGTKRVMMIGFAFTAIVLIFIAGFSMQSPFWQLGTEFFFFGFFLDYTLAPAVDAIRGALPEAKAGVGSGMLSASRMVAGALWVAALGSALSGVYYLALSKQQPVFQVCLRMWSRKPVTP